MSIGRRLGCLVMSIVATYLAAAIPADGSGERDIRQVVVDVIVTDSNNQPVQGLGPLDFQVFEDHKLQQIRSFEAYQQQAATRTQTLPNCHRTHSQMQLRPTLDLSM